MEIIAGDPLPGPLTTSQVTNSVTIALVDVLLMPPAIQVDFQITGLGFLMLPITPVPPTAIISDGLTVLMPAPVPRIISAVAIIHDLSSPYRDSSLMEPVAPELFGRLREVEIFVVMSQPLHRVVRNGEWLAKEVLLRTPGYGSALEAARGVSL